MELSEKKLKKIYEKNLKILNELLKQQGNKTCADCCEKSPKWGSPSLGIFLCIKCAGFHRKMGSSVKSITLDNWSKEETETMIENGNDKVNAIYLHGSNKPLEADYGYIKEKYERKQFSQKKSDKEALSILENMGFTRKSLNLRALDLSGGNVEDALELLLSGALGEASSPVKPSKGKSRAPSEDPPAERQQDFNLPKLSAKKGIQDKSELGSSMSLGSIVNGSRDDISNSSKKNQDERIKQALENAMNQLASFGFTDVSDTSMALRKARGDVEKALSFLIQLKEERILKENSQKQQKEQDQAKQNIQPNLLGSMDNISQSGHLSRDQAGHQQPSAHNHNMSSLRYELGENHQNQSQSLNADFDGKLPLNISPHATLAAPHIDQQVPQTYQNHQNMLFAQNNPDFKPQPLLETQKGNGFQTVLPTQQSVFRAPPQHTPQPTQLFQESTQQSLQQTQRLKAAPEAQQNPIDIFSSDQFNSGPDLRAQPIQPSVNVFDFLGSSSATSLSNPFAAKPLLPTVSGKTNENFMTNSIKSRNVTQPTALSNDLAGLSFNAVPANPAKHQNDQNLPAITQNITGPQGKSSKDTIMSLFSTQTKSQSEFAVPVANPMLINPFMMNQQQPLINQQQNAPSRSQPRLSLTKTVNANPFMNAITVNMANQNNFNHAVPNHAVASMGMPKNAQVGGDVTSTRNYQLDNYSATSLGKSEIFSAPPQPTSEKEKIQSSLFSDLNSFRR